MSVDIPYDYWQPLSLAAVRQLFADAPFTWGVAGGYAVEQFLGAPTRDHADMDIVVYRDQQSRIHTHLTDWRLYASDPPGALRPWAVNEYLPYGIHDVWGHRLQARAWELQLMLAETDGDHWFLRGNSQIRDRRDDLIVPYGGVPCIRVEVHCSIKREILAPKTNATSRRVCRVFPPTPSGGLRIIYCCCIRRGMHG